jgi:hypothetical protein
MQLPFSKLSGHDLTILRDVCNTLVVHIWNVLKEKSKIGLSVHGFSYGLSCFAKSHVTETMKNRMSHQEGFRVFIRNVGNRFETYGHVHTLLFKRFLWRF